MNAHHISYETAARLLSENATTANLTYEDGKWLFEQVGTVSPKNALKLIGELKLAVTEHNDIKTTWMMPNEQQAYRNALNQLMTAFRYPKGEAIEYLLERVRVDNDLIVGFVNDKETAHVGYRPNYRS